MVRSWRSKVDRTISISQIYGEGRSGNVSYELEIPHDLVAVHPVFHISMLKKCLGDPLLIIPT